MECMYAAPSQANNKRPIHKPASQPTSNADAECQPCRSLYMPPHNTDVPKIAIVESSRVESSRDRCRRCFPALCSRPLDSFAT